eukprot:scaffold17619_cov15-Tisochrysis_lutea.AAC.1
MGGIEAFERAQKHTHLVTSLVSKMENMQLQQLDVQSMLSSFTPKSGELHQCICRGRAYAF